MNKKLIRKISRISLFGLNLLVYLFFSLALFVYIASGIPQLDQLNNTYQALITVVYLSSFLVLEVLVLRKFSTKILLWILIAGILIYFLVANLARPFMVKFDDVGPYAKDSYVLAVNRDLYPPRYLKEDQVVIFSEEDEEQEKIGVIISAGSDSSNTIASGNYLIDFGDEKLMISDANIFYIVWGKLYPR